MKTSLVLTTIISALASAAPAAEADSLAPRQCNSGITFQGGDCAIYGTDNFPINARCEDLCVAEATRQGCCNPGAAVATLIESDCAAIYRKCSCSC